MANIKKGDLVQVISGPTEARGGSRGKQGRVIEVLAEKDRVIVEGVNFVTKHVRVGQTQRGTKTGGIETHEAPIHVSNVALVDPDTKKPTRVGFRTETVEKNGVKRTVRVRYAKKSGKDLYWQPRLPRRLAQPSRASSRSTAPRSLRRSRRSSASPTCTRSLVS